jgi:hypothetical protein
VILDRFEQLGLQIGRHFTDFIHEQCSAVGLLQQTAMPGRRAGKGARFMTEQFGFEPFARQRGTVDFNHRLS